MKDQLTALMSTLSAMQTQYDTDVKAAHDAGFSEGVASVPVAPSVDATKIFTQADVDAAVAASKVAILAAIKADEINLEKVAE